MSQQPEKVSKPPVEEDLDDLDDVLDQFSKPPVKEATITQVSASSSTTTAPSSSVPKKDAAPPTSTIPNIDFSDDFARELTMGMKSLMQEIASEAGVDGPSLRPEDDDGEPLTEEEKEQQRKFKAAWEAMLIEGMGGELDPESLAKGKASGSGLGSNANADVSANTNQGGGSVDDFQASIKRAMEKLKESDANAQDAAANATTDSFETLLSQLSQGISEGGGASDEELKGFLDSMMSQLMSKDVLYEPLTELHEKLPGYLEEHASDLSAEDKTRYSAQYTVVSKILTVYNDPAYSDQNTEMTAQVVELMNEMQSHGSPPSDLMGPLPAGFNLGSDGMPKLPDECPVA